MGGRGPGPVMAGGGARPPPPRLPANLPALQGMGHPPGGGPDNMGMGRGGPSGQNGMGGVGKNGHGGAHGAPGGGGVDDGGSGPSINVYVGKLKAEADNSLVQELLTCCGRVEKWNRAVDPSTDLPKAFGFCTYRNARAAAVSVQVGFQLNSQLNSKHVSIGNIAAGEFQRENSSERFLGRITG